MSTSRLRLFLLGLGGVLCVLILMRFLTAEPAEEVPLMFVSGKHAMRTRVAAGVSDLWQVKRMSAQAREMPEGPKKNIFAPLGESMVVEATTVAAKRAKQSSSPVQVVAVVPPPPPVVEVVPSAPPGPTPEELAEQAARQQEEFMRKQVHEQMGQYRYLGYLNQHGVQKAFVGKGKEIYIIRKGDTLDGKFLVGLIDPAAVKLKEPTTSIETSIELKKDGDLGPS